jgi:hypothetical protein
MSATRVYPANLCPLSSVVEFASLGEDFGQSVGESIKAAAGRAVWQGTAEHLDGVLSEQEGIGNAIQACTRRHRWRFRLWHQMPGPRAGQEELTLQIVACDLDVLHAHLGLNVAEERHQGRQADASAHHPSGICVPQLMRNDTLGNADRGRGVGEIWAQLFHQCLLAFVACQQPPIGRGGIEGTEEAQALDKFTDK